MIISLKIVFNVTHIRKNFGYSSLHSIHLVLLTISNSQYDSPVPIFIAYYQFKIKKGTSSNKAVWSVWQTLCIITSLVESASLYCSRKYCYSVRNFILYNFLWLLWRFQNSFILYSNSRKMGFENSHFLCSWYMYKYEYFLQTGLIVLFFH